MNQPPNPAQQPPNHAEWFIGNFNGSVQSLQALPEDNGARAVPLALLAIGVALWRLGDVIAAAKR